MTLPTTLDHWLAHCEQLHPKTIDMTLERVRLLCERLELRFTCPVVAVAGTNGKGSSCAMLESVALQAGYRVGLYIKPHLVHFNERCRINGEMVEGDYAASSDTASHCYIYRHKPEVYGDVHTH